MKRNQLMAELMDHDTRIGVTGIAYLFGVREKTIYQWIKDKADFPTRGDDGRWSEVEVQAWAGKHHVPTNRARA